MGDLYREMQGAGALFLQGVYEENEFIIDNLLKTTRSHEVAKAYLHLNPEDQKIRNHMENLERDLNHLTVECTKILRKGGSPNTSRTTPDSTD